MVCYRACKGPHVARKRGGRIDLARYLLKHYLRGTDGRGRARRAWILSKNCSWIVASVKSVEWGERGQFYGHTVAEIHDLYLQWGQDE